MTPNLVRWGGLAGVVAGAAYAGAGIVELFAPQQLVFTSFSDYLIEYLFVVALLGTLAVIAGLHALQRVRYGRLGTAGSLLAFAGHALMLVAATATALARREALDAVFPMGALAALVGSVLLGTATLRAGILPRFYGVLLIAYFPLSMVVAAVLGTGSIVLAVFWALVGYALLSRYETGSARSVRDGVAPRTESP